jgi:hypothetical protein
VRVISGRDLIGRAGEPIAPRVPKMFSAIGMFILRRRDIKFEIEPENLRGSEKSLIRKERFVGST